TANAVGELAATAGGAFAFTNGLLLTVGAADVCAPALLAGVTAGGPVVLTADDMAINANVTAIGQRVTLTPLTPGQAISLGANTPGFGLTDAELDRVTAATLQIGSAAAGDITFRGAVSPAGTAVLSLQTGGAVVDANAVGADVTVANLAV